MRFRKTDLFFISLLVSCLLFFSSCQKGPQKTAVDWHKDAINFASQGKNKEAINCFNKALKLDPMNTIIWNERGMVLANMGRFGDAIKCFDKVMKIDPNNEEARKNKEFVLIMAKKAR
ncbi:MAG TPA: tetratricopeptide repeat protein [Candidatus Eremiobacteraeota bacterium]|nr:MAG: lipoprotein NlpI [bacterium ADurb.Bin363]HPZ08184.1 tetratricopeptide repeat protein [Candidatus Eremiobacteraeota bacterium]